MGLIGRMRKQSVGGFALRAALMLVAAVALSGCLSRGGKIPYDPADFGKPDKAQSAEIAYDLPLGPLDLLKVNVFRVPELSGDYQVDAKGMLDLPLLGPLNVRDFSPQQLADLLEAKYGERYINDPEISVRVMSTILNSVTVEGGVNVPGVHQLPGKTTLLGAVALARGVATLDANPRRVAIFRKIDGKTSAAAFDLIAIRRGEMNDPDVYPGDTIVVDSSLTRSIYRDLLQVLPLISIFRPI
jgi:polysaccharide export outer membrane protein